MNTVGNLGDRRDIKLKCLQDLYTYGDVSFWKKNTNRTRVINWFGPTEVMNSLEVVALTKAKLCL